MEVYIHDKLKLVCNVFVPQNNACSMKWKGKQIYRKCLEDIDIRMNRGHSCRCLHVCKDYCHTHWSPSHSDVLYNLCCICTYNQTHHLHKYRFHSLHLHNHWHFQHKWCLYILQDKICDFEKILKRCSNIFILYLILLLTLPD